MKRIFSLLIIFILSLFLYSFLADIKYWNGYMLLISGNYFNSSFYFLQSLKEEPTDVKACFLCGDSMMRMRDFERALEIFKYCNSLNQNFPFINARISYIEDVLLNYRKIFIGFKPFIPNPISDFQSEVNDEKLVEVREFIKKYSKDKEAELSGIVEILLFVSKGEYREAEKAILYSRNREPLVEFKEYLLAYIYYITRDDTKFLNIADDFIKRNQHSILLPYFKLLLAEFSLEKGLNDKAADYIIEATDSKFYPSELIDKIIQRAIIFISKTGKQDKYYSDLISSIIKNKIVLNSYKTYMELINSIVPQNLSSDVIFNFSSYLSEVNMCEGVEYLFRNYDESLKIPEAKFIEAKCLFKMGKYELAKELINKVILDKNISSKLKDEIKLLNAKVLMKLKEYDKAEAIVSECEENETLICEVVKLKLFLISLKNKEPYDYIEKIVNKYPGKKCLGELLIKLGHYYNANKSYDKALSCYEKYVGEFSDPINSSSALFWIWKIKKDEKALYKIINLYPYSYYSFRSTEILGDDIFEDNWVFPLFFVLPDKDTIVAEDYERIGLLDLSYRVFKKMVDEMPIDESANDGLSRILYKKGKFLKATKILEELCLKKPSFFIKIMKSKGREVLFPQLYGNEVKEFSDMYKIEPALVFSVIRQESRFTSNIVSSSGAIGLMQIMPSTGKWIGQQMIENNNYSDEILYKARDNIKYGLWYLNYLKKKFKEDYLIVAAYNGGPGNVEKWLKNIPVDDIDLFIELIPKDETRDYVKKVKFNYWIYKKNFPIPNLQLKNTDATHSPIKN